MERLGTYHTQGWPVGPVSPRRPRPTAGEDALGVGPSRRATRRIAAAWRRVTSSEG